MRAGWTVSGPAIERAGWKAQKKHLEPKREGLMGSGMDQGKEMGPRMEHWNPLELALGMLMAQNWAFQMGTRWAPSWLMAKQKDQAMGQGTEQRTLMELMMESLNPRQLVQRILRGQSLALHLESDLDASCLRGQQMDPETASLKDPETRMEQH